MNLITITPPAEEPVSVSLMKMQLRVDGNDEDPLIGAMITAAREVCETISRRAFITQTLELRMDEFPADVFSLPRPPLASLVSMKYMDEIGVEHPISSSNLVIDTTSEPGRLTLAVNASWPGATLLPIGGVRIQYTAGYGDTGNDVPLKYRQAVRMLAAYYYEQREASIVEHQIRDVPFGVRMLLTSDRGAW